MAGYVVMGDNWAFGYWCVRSLLSCKAVDLKLTQHCQQMLTHFLLKKEKKSKQAISGK